MNWLSRSRCAAFPLPLLETAKEPRPPCWPELILQDQPRPAATFHVNMYKKKQLLISLWWNAMCYISALRVKKNPTTSFCLFFFYRCDCLPIYSEEQPCQTGSGRVVVSFFLNWENVWRLALKGPPWSCRDAFNATEQKFCFFFLLWSHFLICNVVFFSSAIKSYKSVSVLHLLSLAASAVRCVQVRVWDFEKVLSHFNI